MSWWNNGASTTQITQGNRFWLYAVASIIMLLLIRQANALKNVR